MDHRQRLLTTIILLLGALLAAQPRQDINLSVDKTDSTAAGSFEVGSRFYSMGTSNAGPGNEFGALGTSLQMGAETPDYFGFRFRASTNIVFRFWDDNLDPKTGQTARYEQSLFDREISAHQGYMLRLEAFYLQYRFRKHQLRLGAQEVQSPLLNAQHNRLLSSHFTGLWGVSQGDKIRFQGGYLWAAAPRGTLHQLELASSMGVYSTGRGPLYGTGMYGGKVNSKGLFALGAEVDDSSWSAKLYDYYLENVFNIAYGQVKFTPSIAREQFLIFGIQSMWETAVQQGGHPHPAYRYIRKNEQTVALGFRLGWKNCMNTISINGLWIGDQGRFLFPREWGREQFWASLSRERFEGQGNLRSIAFVWDHDWQNNKFHTKLGAGFTDSADFEDLDLNKYGMMDYSHIVLEADYSPDILSLNSHLKVLLVYKGDLQTEVIPSQWILNRANLWHGSLILDINI